MDKVQLHSYAQSLKQELYDLACSLAVIPAPSGKEDKRARYCLDWFHDNGMKKASIDQAGNVVLALGKPPYQVFMAHMDVVFPDESPLPLVEEEGIIHCPGIMDNTINLAVMMMTARYVSQKREQMKKGGQDLDQQAGFLFVCSVGEEGLGNLKGVRQICKDYAAEEDRSEASNPGQIQRFYALDLTLNQYTALAVGSLRYEVKITSPGGHSFLNFGSPNANLLLSRFVCGFYDLPIPAAGHTTYNVGLQQGGTSVNTIAQEASALLEMRSDCYDSLQTLRQDFEHFVEVQKASLPADCSLTLICIGDRPCEKDVDEAVRKKMFAQVEAAVSEVAGLTPKPISCSTDCNLPLSLGIPSVCVGTCIGAGAHTRQEWAKVDSFVKGFEIVLRLVEEGNF